MKILLITLFGFLYFSLPLYAQTDTELRMIKDFKKAVSSKDQDKIHVTWLKLWERDDVVDYMKKNMPDEFLLYKSHRLVMRVDNMQRKYSGGSSQFSKSEFTSSAYTSSSRVSTSGGSHSSNRDATKKNPNQNRVSNNITARRSLNQDRPSNQRLMRNSTNNTRRTRRFSNNRRYQRRQRPNRVR